MKSSRLITPPVVEPVTLDEMKAHARINDDADDELLSALLIAARQWCETYTRRAFIAQTWAQYLSSRPSQDRIRLIRPPLISVTAVRTYDDQDQETLWENNNYFIDAASEPALLVLRNGKTWANFERAANGMLIEYIAGYGVVASDVPAPLRLAIKQLALHWYEHRGEALLEGATAKVPLVIEGLLQPYRLLGLGAA
ncbi:MAG: head-tail connector protein [Alphaproteobacteria bacterium]|nr:head-tail connector protein [Alphaproteobacteria bacterium]